MSGVTGVIKLYKSEQGYGFIQRDDDGKDVFVHARQLKDSNFTGEPGVGDRLSFEVQDGERGPRAVNISRT